MRTSSQILEKETNGDYQSHLKFPNLALTDLYVVEDGPKVFSSTWKL